VFNSIIQATMTLPVFFICTGAAAVLGVLNALVFSFKSHHSSSLTLTLAVLPPVVAMVIMMVNGNIGTGVAIAGAFALVRFRTVPGTAKEITGIFLSMAIGLTCGKGHVAIAAVFFAFIAVFVLILLAVRFGEASSSYRYLTIEIPENLDYEGLFDDLLAKYSSRYELVKVRTVNMGTIFELTYEIRLKSADVSKEFLDEIRCRNGNLKVVCSRNLGKELM